ncbi:MAG: hypothetical protein LBV75_07870 [Paludibacter sp.]|jgi:hypothetical protein|nr:hypothetical protein [Paludibacter sp.]
MKKIFLFSFVFSFAFSIKAQEFKDSLYIHLYDFQIITGELNPNDLDLNDLSRYYYIGELVESANTKAFGIYVFYNLKFSHSVSSFLIIEDENYEIYDIFSSDDLIEKILDLKCCDETTKKDWIKAILNNLRSFNEKFELGELTLRKKYGKYHYIFALKNLKNDKGIIE